MSENVLFKRSGKMSENDLAKVENVRNEQKSIKCEKIILRF